MSKRKKDVQEIMPDIEPVNNLTPEEELKNSIPTTNNKINFYFKNGFAEDVTDKINVIALPIKYFKNFLLFSKVSYHPCSFQFIFTKSIIFDATLFIDKLYSTNKIKCIVNNVVCTIYIKKFYSQEISFDKDGRLILNVSYEVKNFEIKKI